MVGRIFIRGEGQKSEPLDASADNIAPINYLASLSVSCVVDLDCSFTTDHNARARAQTWGCF